MRVGSGIAKVYRTYRTATVSSYGSRS